MSTNIFNASNVMAPTLNNGVSHHHGGLHHHHHPHHPAHSNRHHHHPHHPHHHGSAIMDPILFPTTPVGGSGSNGTTILSQNSPTTAFPFPPPSPGYLSSTSSTTLNHLQHQLPSWMSPSPILMPNGGKLSTIAKESTFSDNNNNELIAMSPMHLSTSSKNFKLHSAAEDSKTRSNHHQHYHSNQENSTKEVEENNQSAFKPATITTDSKEKLHFAIDSPGTNNTCSPTMNKALKTTTPTAIQNNGNSQSDLTWPNSEHSKPPSSSSSSSSPFMLANSYLNGSSSSSSTSPNSYGSSGSVGTSSVVSHLRPNPTSPSAFSYPHYLIPPIYSYYQQAAIAAAAAAAAANPSPTTTTTTASQPPVNSPMSPFVVPNGPHGPHYPPPPISSPNSTAISSNNPNNNNPSIGSIFFHDSMFPPQPSSTTDHHLQSDRKSKPDENMNDKADKLNHKDLIPQIIDLTAKRKCDNNINNSNGNSSGSIGGNSPSAVEQIKHTSDSNNGSLKRKSPDCSMKQTNSINGNDSSKVNAITATSSASLTSRKHRILKPPNINITETPCETTLRNGFHSAFLPSPLYSPHLSNHRLAPSSPYTSYLDHVPLSAPPIPQLHHSNNNSNNSNSQKCFEFPNEVSALSTVLVNGGGGGGGLCSKESSMINSHVSNNNQSGNNNAKCHRSNTCSTSASLSSTSILQKNNNNNNVIQNNRKSDIQHKPTAFQIPTKPIANKVVQGDNQNHHHHHQQQQQQKQKILNQDSSKSLMSMTSNINVNGQNKKQTPTSNGGQFPEYFRKGSTIKLGDGNLKKIEELSTEDFIESATRNEKFRVEFAEVVSLKEKSTTTTTNNNNNNKKGHIRIGFLVGQTRAKVSLDSPSDHPFFVYQKGWSSCSPNATGKRYGLNCRRLNLGDIVVTLANKPLPPTSLPATPTTPWNKSSQSSLASSSSSLSSNHSSGSQTSQTLLFNNTYPCAPPPPPPPPPPPAHSSHQKHNAQQPTNNCVLNLDSKRKQSTNHEPEGQDRANTVAVDDDDEIDVENIDDDDDLEKR